MRNSRLQTIALCLLSTVFFVSGACADPIKSKEELVAAYKDVFRNKDADRLIALQCFDGAEEDDIRAVKEYLTNAAKTETKVSEINWLPPKGNEDKFASMGGRPYKYNLPVIGRIKVDFQADESGEPKSFTFAIGNRGEELLMAMRVPAR
ncbi:MAG TPA: hypothetical protein V6D17_13805 [Candidatus Obscuribacterales bacterium]